MSESILVNQRQKGQQSSSLLGPPGYLAVFLGSLGLTLLAPTDLLFPAALLSLLIVRLVFPFPLQSLLRTRWIILILLMVVPVVLSAGLEIESGLSLALTSEGILLGGLIMLRTIVILVAVMGFTSAVDISTIAGLLEKFGMRGLGFSMGVAINFLPALQQSAVQTWHSLWMRGGLRKQRWRGLRMMALTIGTSALRRAEGIALAAQVRAYSPERSRALPIEVGRLDLILIIVVLLSLIVIQFVI